MVGLLNKGILQMDLFQPYQFRDGRALRRLPNKTFLNCVARMGYNNGPPNSGQPTSVNFVTVERGNGVFVRDDPPADVEWPDTDSDDDGPYVRYGQTVALSGWYPTFTETQDQSSDTSDDEEMEFEVYPVERSEKRTTRERKTRSKVPSKSHQMPSKERTRPDRPGLRTRASGPIPEQVAERQPTPFSQPPPIVNIPPEPIPLPVNIPEEDPVPFDAWRVCFNVDMSSREPHHTLHNELPVTSNPTLADVPMYPPTQKGSGHDDQTSKEKTRSGPRQSEVSSQVDSKAVIQGILDTPVALLLQNLLGSSKELSMTLQEMIRVRNNPQPPIPGTSIFPAKINSIGVKGKPKLARKNGMLIHLPLTYNNHPLDAVIDTGSELNVISKSLALTVLQLPIDLTKGIYMNDANGGAGYLKGLIEDVVLECGPVKTCSNIFVGENVLFELLLGRPDALALVRHKEHLENTPEGSDEGLEILRHRLRHINIVENTHPRHSELWQASDFLPNGNKKVDGIYMLLNSADGLGNNGMNLNYLSGSYHFYQRNPYLSREHLS